MQNNNLFDNELRAFDSPTDCKSLHSFMNNVNQAIRVCFDQPSKVQKLFNQFLIDNIGQLDLAKYHNYKQFKQELERQKLEYRDGRDGRRCK